MSSGSLAGLAFKAENEMPALLVMQPRARVSLLQSSDLARDIVSVELCWPSLAHSDRGYTNKHKEIELTKSHSSESLSVCLSVCLPTFLSPRLTGFLPLSNKTKFFKEITFEN